MKVLGFFFVLFLYFLIAAASGHSQERATRGFAGVGWGGAVSNAGLPPSLPFLQIGNKCCSFSLGAFQVETCTTASPGQWLQDRTSRLVGG